MREYDAIVIGAGPAGAATAIYLRRAGHSVLLLDRAEFPRDKVCGEFISPAADPILRHLGVLDAIEARSPCRLRGVTISAHEKKELRIDYPASPEAAGPMTSLSLPRAVLDGLLVEAAGRAGVEVCQRHKVDGLIFAAGAVAGVEGFDGTQRRFAWRARVVVDAGGRNGISLRRLGLKKPLGRRKRIALAAHWQGVTLPDNHCYMHVSWPGYTGIAAVGKDLVNVVLVVDHDCLRGAAAAKFYLRAVRGNALRAELLRGGAPVERPRAVDSLAFSVRPVPCDGLILVGDAMGFIDPFTGEGIYLALKSAGFAAQTVGAALAGGGRFRRADFLAYDRLRIHAFRKRFLLSRIIRRLVDHPALSVWFVDALARNPHLAGTLAGVIGDYLPAERAMSWRFLLDILRGRAGMGKRF